MKKNNLIVLAVAFAIVVVGAVNVTNAENAKTEPGNKEEASVAWFVSNMKEAKEQNKLCHDNPSIQSSPSCVNSLHALQISFAGGNRTR
ncbi:MAG: hypothetical protein ABL919_13820 [Methylococcales bacterium]|nr:hypothetical protein [Methylococcaceae bacterium]